MGLYALNLFDLAENDDYRAYSRESPAAVERHGGRVVALGRFAVAAETTPAVAPRQVMIVVEWPDRGAFDAFLADETHAPLHRLRENGTQNYIWWLYESLDDLRPLLSRADRTSS